MSKWAPLPLRIILGSSFAYHGLSKSVAASGHSSFREMLEQIGMPFPALTSWLVALLELFGGFAVLAGALLPLASSILIVHMLAAMFTIHLPAGFIVMHVTGMSGSGPEFGMPGYEINLLYIGGLLSLLLSGGGPYSVDRFMKRRKKQQDKQTVITVELPDRGAG